MHIIDHNIDPSINKGPHHVQCISITKLRGELVNFAQRLANFSAVLILYCDRRNVAIIIHFIPAIPHNALW